MKPSTISLSGNHKERILTQKQSKLEFKHLDVSSICKVLIEEGLQKYETGIE